MGSKRIYVLADLPRSGLGNRLFVWAKACIFANQHNLKLQIRGWARFSVGTWLRREKRKRFYGNYFVKADSLQNRFSEALLLKKQIVNEPPLGNNYQLPENVRVFRFHKQPHYSDFFKDIKHHRNLVKKAFTEMVSPTLAGYALAKTPPVIGVHIRRGDFKVLQEGQDFSKVGATRTPLHYFVSMINHVRTLNGNLLPVTVFTDGHSDEIEEVLKLPAVQLAEQNADVVDLILLSRSKLIITSAGSTFSYWAGFLSNAPILMHPDHIYNSIRPAALAEQLYEGPWDDNNNILCANILNISGTAAPIKDNSLHNNL